MPQTIAAKVLSRVYGRGRGTVVTPADFLDIGGRAAVDQALSRLVKRGILHRLGRGMYHYPKASPKFGPMAPPLDAVARAVARKRGVRLQPTGAKSSNALGLSTQVPAQATYLTDAPSSSIKVGKQTVILKHAAPRRLIDAGSTPTAVIEALRHLGQDGVTDAVVARLARTLSVRDKADLARARRRAPTWMHPALSAITGDPSQTRRRRKSSAG